jgi:uncharacterized protein YdiU (UPF0061 family)
MQLADSYSRLPAHFYTRIDPTRVVQPRLIRFNAPLADELGLDLGALSEPELADIFSGNRLLPESHPIAMVYAGHQFGQFVPQLGDGRAILLGEVRDRTGNRRDIQLKGSGRTPYSRGGDGRAAVGPVLREYLVSEAMHALGLPTTRALAAVTTGEAVFREQRVPGAVLTRVAASHVRVGTFQYFAARGDAAATRQLADYVIERHYPDAAAADNPYLELLRGVLQRQARLVAGWMNIGFIHGVMNTDNMAVSGETIDFGPCAFMEAYGPATVFSSIDQMGRYAYANQPAAAQWNLVRFAETLLRLIDEDSARAVEQATTVIAEFSREFDDHWLSGMRLKLGLFTEEDGDRALIRGLLEIMHQSEADFTLTFRRLCAAAESEVGDAPLAALFKAPDALRDWLPAWRSRLAREPQPRAKHAAFMRLVNPFVIPRNHRIEAVIAAAVAHGDYAPFERLSQVLARPYEERAEFAAYTEPALPAERVTQTFCGT